LALVIVGGRCVEKRIRPQILVFWGGAVCGKEDNRITFVRLLVITPLYRNPAFLLKYDDHSIFLQ
jgi:hypothetical protein